MTAPAVTYITPEIETLDAPAGFSWEEMDPFDVDVLSRGSGQLYVIRVMAPAEIYAITVALAAARRRGIRQPAAGRVKAVRGAVPPIGPAPCRRCGAVASTALRGHCADCWDRVRDDYRCDYPGCTVITRHPRSRRPSGMCGTHSNGRPATR